MKSVGEVMAVGRSFQESLQKALRSLETGLCGLDEQDAPTADDENTRKAALKGWISGQNPDRILRIAEAMRCGLSVAEIQTTTHWDKWFLEQIAGIVAAEAFIRREGLPDDKLTLHQLKSMGFGDARLAILSGRTEQDVTALRTALGITPVYKRIDTCAAEFASDTAYLYSSFETQPAQSVRRPRPSQK